MGNLILPITAMLYSLNHSINQRVEMMRGAAAMAAKQQLVSYISSVNVDDEDDQMSAMEEEIGPSKEPEESGLSGRESIEIS